MASAYIGPAVRLVPNANSNGIAGFRVVIMHSPLSAPGGRRLLTDPDAALWNCSYRESLGSKSSIDTQQTPDVEGSAGLQHERVSFAKLACESI